MTLDYSSIQQSRSVRISMNGSAAECKVCVSPSLFPFYELAKRSNREYESGLSAIVCVSVCIYVSVYMSACMCQWVTEREDDRERNRSCMRERM